MPTSAFTNLVTLESRSERIMISSSDRLRIGALGAASDAQDALDRAQAPVVVVLLGEQLHVEVEEPEELDRERLGRRRSPPPRARSR